MNERERKAAQRHLLLDSELRALRNGAPDFLMLKIRDGEIIDMYALEVKSPGSKLSYEQSVYRKVFERAGIKYVVEVEP